MQTWCFGLVCSFKNTKHIVDQRKSGPFFVGTSCLGQGQWRLQGTCVGIDGEFFRREKGPLPWICPVNLDLNPTSAGFCAAVFTPVLHCGRHLMYGGSLGPYYPVIALKNGSRWSAKPPDKFIITCELIVRGEGADIKPRIIG